MVIIRNFTTVGWLQCNQSNLTSTAPTCQKQIIGNRHKCNYTIGKIRQHLA